MITPKFSLGKTFRQEDASVKEEITVLPQYSAGKSFHQDEQAVVSDQETSKAKNETIESLRKDENLSGSKLPFLWKLHILLDDVETTGNDRIVSWLEHGRSFKVYRPKSFMALIVPHYFKQSKYKSFQRQLHLYEFTRMQYGPEAGSYSHPLFLRGQPTLCLSLSPIKIKGKARRKFSDASSAPSQNQPLVSQQACAFPGKAARPPSVASAVLSRREQDEWVAKINRMLVKGSTLAAERRQSPQTVQTLNEPEAAPARNLERSNRSEAMYDDTCCLFGGNFHLLPAHHDVKTCSCCYDSDTESDDLDFLLQGTE
jgi:hypothetical protein